MMPQTGSQTPRNFPTPLIFVPNYEDAATHALNFAFSTPSPPTHAHDVVENILHHEYETYENLEFIVPMFELLQYEHTLQP